MGFGFWGGGIWVLRSFGIWGLSFRILGFGFCLCPVSGGIPGRVHFWEVPFALMLSPGWLGVAFAPRRDTAHGHSLVPQPLFELLIPGSGFRVRRLGFEILIEG